MMAKTKIFGSLVKRIVLLFLVLVVLPLLLYLVFLWKQDLTIQDRAIQTEKELITSFAKSYLQLWGKEGLEPVETRKDLREGQSIFYVKEGRLYALKNEKGRYFGKSEALEEWKKNLGFSSVFVEADGSIQVRLSPEEIQSYTGDHVFVHVLVLLAIVACVGGLGALLLARRIGKPLLQLEQVMRKVGGGEYGARYVEDRYGFEINDLGRDLNGMLTALLANMEKAKELEIGRKVQAELLPRVIPTVEGLSVGVGFSPAQEVAGDYYDLFARDGELLISVADGAGKGVSACLYSLLVRSMIRAHLTAGEGLQEIIEKTNRLFMEDTKDTGNFVTAWVGLYKEGELTYTSCGHLPGMVLRENGEIEELWTEGTPFGANLAMKVTIQKAELRSGDLLLLYSDGVTEAHNEKGELFTQARLKRHLSSHRALAPQELIDSLLAEVHQFAGATAQHDDLTLLTLKVH